MTSIGGGSEGEHELEEFDSGDSAPRIGRALLVGEDDVLAGMTGSTVIEKAIAIGKLLMPQRTLTRHGQYEGMEFWHMYADLFEQAFKELPKKHPMLYKYNDVFKQRFINPQFLSAVSQLRQSAKASPKGATIDESPVRSMLYEHKEVKGIFELTGGMFTDEFRHVFLEELEHIGNSGIPMRRPNSMNRYGAVLATVGLKETFDHVAQDFIQPLIEMLFPDYISHEDACENYSFIVDYEKDPTKDTDVDLKEHRDSSIATLNVCLGYDNFTGGNLLFRADEKNPMCQCHCSHAYDSSKGEGIVAMRPGLSILHKGQHRHGALPITGGRRANLIVWMMGRGGYVNTQRYPPAERMTARDRWSKP